jgi:hypothetical protein
MTYDEARFRIILFSLCLTGVLLPFFFLAPTIGYPLSPDQSRQVISQVLPVFLGYLGAGVAFMFSPPGNKLPDQPESNKRLLALLINGIFVVFTVSLLAILIGFGVSNARTALPGTGISFPTFSDYITTVISLMNTVVGASVIYLFGVQQQAAPQ